MEAKFVYSEEEVGQLVLEKHSAVFTAPRGMRWVVDVDYHRVNVTLARSEDGDSESA